MLVHAIMAGSVGLILIEPKSIYFMSEIIFFFSLLINLLILFKEIVFHHDSPDTRRTIELITKGYFSKYFWVGIVIGNIIPIFLLVPQK